MFKRARWLIAAILIVSLNQQLEAYERVKIDQLEFDLGAQQGLSSTSTVSPENLQKIVKGVEQGNKENIYFYALLKLYGISVTKNATTAAQNFLRASNLGHKESMTAYGMMLMTGNGVTRDYVEAMQWFRKGVSMGDKNANWLLGKLLMEGKGVSSPQYSEAASLFRAAVEENVPQAEHSLAIMYEYGLGVPQDFHLARKYYRMAAEQNQLESMYNLALMYAYGRGGDQDYNRARSLFDNAASRDHAPSVYYIGILKTYGYGCEPNYDQAMNWFERAAKLDDFRVSEKAAAAVEELRTAMSYANQKNDEVLDELQRRTEVQ